MQIERQIGSQSFLSTAISLLDGSLEFETGEQVYSEEYSQ
jgi:hypothetical protein